MNLLLKKSYLLLLPLLMTCFWSEAQRVVRLPHQPAMHEVPRAKEPVPEPTVQGRKINEPVTGKRKFPLSRFVRSVTIAWKDVQGKTLSELRAEHEGKKLVSKEEDDYLTVREKAVDGKKQTVVEIEKGVSFVAEKDYKIEDIMRFKTRTFRKKEINVFSILDEVSDKPMFTTLKNAAKENNVNYGTLNLKNVEEKFSKAAGQVMIITSHFEDGKLFARTADYKEIKEKSFEAAQLKKLAILYGVTLIFMGCETKNIGAGAGFEKPVFDKDIETCVTNLYTRLGSGEPIPQSTLLKTLLPEGNSFVIFGDILDKNGPLIIEMEPVKNPFTRSSGEDSLALAEPALAAADNAENDDTLFTVGFFVLTVGVIGFQWYREKKKKQTT